MDKISDCILVERTLSGNRNAFEEIVRRHQDNVYALAMRLVRDRETARDVAQDTFVRAYTRLSTFHMDGSLRNWLLTICVNQGKNRLRSRSRRRQVFGTYASGTPQALQAEGPDRMIVEEALARIPDKLLLPLTLRHLHGLTYEEVAGVLGIGVSAAKMRTKRARDRLVEIMEGSSK